MFYRPVGIMKFLFKASAVVALCAALSACSTMQGLSTAAGVLGGDTPSVDATAQVGAENRKEGDSVLDTRRVEDRRAEGSVEDAEVTVSEVSGVSNVTSENVSRQQQEETDASSGVSSRDWSAESIQQISHINQIPPLFLFLFALGWVLPGPADILKGMGKILFFFRDLITGRRDG